MAGMAGFEPTNDGVKVRCLTTWLYPYIWGGVWDSNPRHSVPQTDALPTELTPPYFGTLGGIRTPDPLLRRQLLYPTELQAHIFFGAGDGNRTHTTSLEGWDSTIELHPQFRNANYFNTTY